MVKKVFISQPMNGESDDEIIALRDRIMSKMPALTGEDVEFREIPSFFQRDKMRGMNAVRMLGMAIELLSDADVAVFAPGWQYARGCRIENRIAKDYSIPVIELDESDI